MELSFGEVPKNRTVIIHRGKKTGKEEVLPQGTPGKKWSSRSMAKEIGSMVVEELQAELEPFLLPKTCTSTICASHHLGCLCSRQSRALRG